MRVLGAFKNRSFSVEICAGVACIVYSELCECSVFKKVILILLKANTSIGYTLSGVC